MTELFKASISLTSLGDSVGDSPTYTINEVPPPIEVIRWEPSNGSIDINHNLDTIKLVFNRDIQRFTGRITITKDSKTGPIVDVWQVSNDPRNNVSGVEIFTQLGMKSDIGSTVVISQIAGGLSPSTKYCITFTPGIFKDTNWISWEGYDSYDFTTAPASTATSGVSSGVVDKVRVDEYVLDFTAATGECGINVNSAFDRPTAFQLFWDGSSTPVAGTGGTLEKPNYMALIGSINTNDLPTWQKRVGNGTINYLDKNRMPSATNPTTYRFNKTKADPQRARLVVSSFGTTKWDQIMPPSVTVVEGKANFSIEYTDSSKKSIIPPKMDGNTGFVHWNEYQKSVLNEPLNSPTNAKIWGKDGHTNWRTLNADGTKKYVNLGDGFLQFPAGSHTLTYEIENNGSGSGTITGITVSQSNDQLLSPGFGSSWANAMTTTVSNMRIASVKAKENGKGTPVSGFPVVIQPGYELYFDVTITWPYTYYSPTFDWVAQTGKSSPTVGDVRNHPNSKVILANFKSAVQDPMVKLRNNLLRWEVSPSYTNAETIPASANVSMVSSSKNIVTADPLAQTFFIQPGEYPDGMFVSSVDLFFKRKSLTDDITVQIRPVVNGFPSSADIVPFAISSLTPSEVKISDYPNSNDATSYTKFKFDTPIYLATGTYAIVILSPSKDYEVFTATVGGFQLDDLDTRISQIPYAGDLFKSSNSQTWLPSPYQDLCFVVNRADFKSSGVAQFVSEKPPTNYSSRYNTFSAVTHYNKGEYIRVEVSTNTDNIYEVLNSGTSGATAPTHTTGDVTSGTISLRFLATGERWQDTIIPYDVYFAQGENLTFKNSEAKYYYKGTNEYGVLDSDFNQIHLGSNYELESRKALDSNVKDLYSRVDLTTIDSKISPVIDIKRLSSVLVQNIINNEVIAPDFVASTTYNAGTFLKVSVDNMYKIYLVIDSGTTSTAAPTFDGSDTLNGSAVLRYVGTTHNGDTELLPAGGMAEARYITRKVILAEGFESTDIVARFNAVTPTGSNIKVYYKAAFVDGNTTLEESPYHEMVLAERASGYDQSFVEHKFVCDYGDNALPGVRYALPNKTRFNQFSIKIVMLSATTVAIPKVRDLRVMALDD